MLAFYGESATPKDVLFGRVPPPSAAKVFLTAVRSAEEQAKNNQKP
jgi:lipid-binding SYLF domain-containing protein